MKITSHLFPEQIRLDVPLGDKGSVLRFVAEVLQDATAGGNADKIFAALAKREALMSTGIGGGIAIPHALTPEVDDLAIILIRLRSPIPYEALDNLPVDIVIGMAVPEHETTLHLRALAGISGLCKKPGMLAQIRRAGDPGELWERIRRAEEGAEGG
jgi:mannitol/fructose-specific phosphotransferase system IIA component (Ntr-type)